jgi:hypothetical protein
MPPRKGQRWRRTLFARTPEILTCVLCPTTFERRHSQHKYCDDCSDKARLKRMREWHKANKDTQRQYQADYYKGYYEMNRSKIETKVRRYTQTSKGKEVHRKATQNQRERNPIKTAARQMVRCAIVCGVLIRQSCERCGDPKTEGHHDDYSKPLDVRWLCRPCHKDHHRKARGARWTTNP